MTGRTLNVDGVERSVWLPQVVRKLPAEMEATKWKPGLSGNPGGRSNSLARRTRELVGSDGEPLNSPVATETTDAPIPVVQGADIL